MSNRFLFCVFSYNRGRFLENCVTSIAACVPEADIAIFDDDSNDESTQEVLSKLSQRMDVVQPHNRSSHKLGGLYGNMQSALEYARDRELICFIQDDMQVVRPVQDEEILDLNNFFDNNPEVAFLHPCFLKGMNRARDNVTLTYDPSMKMFRRRATGQSAGQYFADILITRPSRLLDINWRFRLSEPANDLQARQYFQTIGHMFAPIAMWLPEVSAYRGKRKTLALKIAERWRGCGFYPYKILSESEIHYLQERSINVLPFAEDFLTCFNPDLEKPWGYYPMQGSRFLKKLNSLELSLKKLLNGTHNI